MPRTTSILLQANEWTNCGRANQVAVQNTSNFAMYYFFSVEQPSEPKEEGGVLVPYAAITHSDLADDFSVWVLSETEARVAVI